MLLGCVSVLLIDVSRAGEELELIPSWSESTGNGHGSDFLCFLDVNEGKTSKLCFELVRRWNRLRREAVRVREPCQY